MVKRMRALMRAAAMGATPAMAQSPGPGEIRGAATAHTPASLAASVEQASVALPASVTGGAPFLGKWKDMPKTSGAKAPVVVFLHGSSGLGLKAIGEWQAWLANLGYASVAPDSFALPDRVTYGSPVPKDFYEKIHALRGSEIVPTLAALGGAGWPDMKRRAGGNQRGLARRGALRRAGDRRAHDLRMELRGQLLRAGARHPRRGRSTRAERHQHGRSFLLAEEQVPRRARRQRPLRRGLRGLENGDHRPDPPARRTRC